MPEYLQNLFTYKLSSKDVFIIILLLTAAVVTASLFISGKRKKAGTKRKYKIADEEENENIDEESFSEYNVTTSETAYCMAKEKYSENDEYYAISQAFTDAIKDEKDWEIFNCRFLVKKGSPSKFNIYIFLSDREKALGKDYNPLFERNAELMRIFEETAEKTSFSGHKGMTENVFIEDFPSISRTHSLAKAANAAENKLRKEIGGFSAAAAINETAVIFVKSEREIRLLERGAKNDKLYEVLLHKLKLYDKDKMWHGRELTLMTAVYDEYSAYAKYGFAGADTESMTPIGKNKYS